MKTISLATLQQQVSARKAQLGMLDTPAEVEALRNKGAARPPEKRELLRRIKRRASAANRQPMTAHF